MSSPNVTASELKKIYKKEEIGKVYNDIKGERTFVFNQFDKSDDLFTITGKIFSHIITLSKVSMEMTEGFILIKLCH